MENKETHTCTKKGFKRYLHIALILMIVAFAYSAISYVNTYSKTIEPGSFRSFTVSSEGTSVAVPDIAQFNFSIVTEGGKELGDLQSENITKMNTILSFVKETGVLEKDIKTTGYNVNPRYQYFNCSRYSQSEGEPCPPPEIVGYTVKQSLTLKIRDFEIIGKLLGGVVERGANNVSQLSFTIDDETELQNKARNEAITKAQDKANSIALAGGFNVGRLLQINEGGNSFVRNQYKSYVEDDSVSFGISSAAPSIEAGSQEITVTVSLTYEID